jgi:predicted alpha-1,6-mannanase (GH76 family)
LTILPPRREIAAIPDYAPAVQLTRLQTIIQNLQQPTNFSIKSGSYPTAIQWTSTVLATILIDYSHLTSDRQYFSNIIDFYHHQPVCNLTTQKYDDKQWVVLTYLRGAAYAAIHDKKWVKPFLRRASFFYMLVKPGWDNSTCGGGMNWGPCSKYKNAVTTELFIATSIGMYEVFGKESMLQAAIRAWVWFKKSGMINAEGLVNDGLDQNCTYTPSLHCIVDRRNNAQTTWTYNQGIVLSGLSKLYKYTGDESLIEAAQNLVDSVLASYLVPSNSGVLVETCDAAGTCDQDQWMFKGVFFEHLGYFLEDITAMNELNVSTRKALLQKYASFVHGNANAVWEIARGEDGRISSWWAGPSGNQTQRQVSVETQGSGAAAITCAIRVDELLKSLEPLNDTVHNIASGSES